MHPVTLIGPLRGDPAHWMHTAQLARRYPKVHVDDSVLYVDDGKKGYRLGLDTLKKMNTKIAYADDLANVDMTKLVKGDYICLQKQE